MSKEILTLFPEVVYTKILTSVSDEELKELLDITRNLQYVKSGHFNKEKNSSASKDLYLFDREEYKNISLKIMDEFNEFKDDVLNYHSNKFIYTTSWATKTEPWETSEWHNHHNCLYSGVFYLLTGKDTGNLMFQDFNKKNLSINPSSYNEYNSVSWQIEPKDKMLVLFPSHLYHKIDTNRNIDKGRVSLAFNFLPVGNVGGGDSQLILDM